MGFFSALFGCGEPQWKTSTSALTRRVGDRYREIIQYFTQHPWGGIVGDMKIVNMLPCVDRTIILEEVMKIKAYANINNITSSLVAAYFVVGFDHYNDFLLWSLPFTDACHKKGLITDAQHDFLVGKIREWAVTPMMPCLSDYKRAKTNLEHHAPECELKDLAVRLCEEYADSGLMIPIISYHPEPVRHPNYGQDRIDFEADRALFLNALN